MTDFFIIGEGNVERHLTSMAEAVIEALQENYSMKPFHKEGAEGWMVLDYLEVVIHLFVPALRDRYRLEQLWKEGKIVDLEFNE